GGGGMPPAVGWENGRLVPTTSNPADSRTEPRSDVHPVPPWADALYRHLLAQAPSAARRPAAWGTWGRTLGDATPDLLAAARADCRRTGRVHLLGAFHDGSGRWTAQLWLVHPEATGMDPLKHGQQLRWRVRTRHWVLVRRQPWLTRRDAVWMHTALEGHIRALLAQEGRHGDRS
ncbi:MAG: hypothetical protein OWS74_00530, partial [Firmicutes bacterium]|nr:hypothetical protein [Bacillota bacterium]